MQSCRVTTYVKTSPILPLSHAIPCLSLPLSSPFQSSADSSSPSEPPSSTSPTAASRTAGRPAGQSGTASGAGTGTDEASVLAGAVENLRTALAVLGQRVLHVPECRRRFGMLLQNLLSDRNSDVHVLLSILEIVCEWVDQEFK